MNTTESKRRALISVNNADKTKELLDFVTGLINEGFEIVSSGGTARYLQENEIPVTDVARFTGYEPVLNHKVVTLAPEIHGGLLATGCVEREELAALSWPKFDLLMVTFYPLAEEMSREHSTFESCVGKTDIGGPTMIRSANKGGEVIVLTKASQMDGVLKWIIDGEPERQTVIDVLRGRAEQAVAAYIALSAQVHADHHDLNAAAAQKYDL